MAGTNDVNVEGNAQDNIIIQNPGDNRIDGAQGVDVVFYEKPYKSLRVSKANGTIQVQGSGTDLLDNIEYIVFKDAVVKINSPAQE